MYCPQCGQERISDATNYCSRCGFLLTGATELLDTGGIIPRLPLKSGPSSSSPRSRGLKQGLFLFLLTFLIVPIIAIITVANDAEPYFVAVASIVLTVGGLLRMLYALMFESTEPGDPTLEESTAAAAREMLKRRAKSKTLPPQQSIPARSYDFPSAGHWRDTNDLQPASVTDSTTKLLEKNVNDQ